MLKLLTPTFRIARVEELTLDRLREWDIGALLLDVDCTLTRYRRREVTPEVAAWLQSLRAGGIVMCLVSNGMGRRIRQFAHQLDLPCVSQAMKPLPRGIRAAMSLLGLRPSRTAIVGDQIFADVLAARMAGIRSILVEPIHPEEEPWFTLVKRRPERWLLRRMRTEG